MCYGMLSSTQYLVGLASHQFLQVRLGSEDKLGQVMLSPP